MSKYIQYIVDIVCHSEGICTFHRGSISIPINTNTYIVSSVVLSVIIPVYTGL